METALSCVLSVTSVPTGTTPASVSPTRYLPPPVCLFDQSLSYFCEPDSASQITAQEVKYHHTLWGILEAVRIRSSYVYYFLLSTGLRPLCLR